MPEDKKQQVKQQFISLIKSMAKEENYVNSINGIFQILDQAQFLAQRVKVNDFDNWDKNTFENPPTEIKNAFYKLSAIFCRFFFLVLSNY